MTHTCDILAGHIRRRCNELDKNYMGVGVGQTGSGKSATCHRICGLVDETFNEECRVVFTPQEFMEVIQSMDKGEAIMFDEAGVGIPAREWQRIQNRLMGYTAQLFRHKNLCVFFTVPSMSFIDAQLRTLMHGIIATKKIDYEQSISIAKYYRVNHDPVFATTKFETFEYSARDGNTYALDPLCTPHPEPQFWKQYLKKKEAFAAKFYAETEAELKGQDKPDGMKLKALNSKADAMVKLVSNLRQEMTWQQISVLSGVSDRTLRDWIGRQAEA